MRISTSRTHSFLLLFRKRINFVFSLFFLAFVWMKWIVNFTSINPYMHSKSKCTETQFLHCSSVCVRVRIPFDCTLFCTINHSLTKTISTRMEMKEKKIEKTFRIRHSITFILYILEFTTPFCLFYFSLYALLFSYVHRTWFLFYISLKLTPPPAHENIKWNGIRYTRKQAHSEWWAWAARWQPSRYSFGGRRWERSAKVLPDANCRVMGKTTNEGNRMCWITTLSYESRSRHIKMQYSLVNTMLRYAELDFRKIVFFSWFPCTSAFRSCFSRAHLCARNWRKLRTSNDTSRLSCTPVSNDIIMYTILTFLKCRASVKSRTSQHTFDSI